MMRKWMLLMAAGCMAGAVLAGPPAVTKDFTVSATVGSYTNTISLSKYGECLELDRFEVQNNKASNATVYLEFQDITGVETIASGTVTGGGATVLRPRRGEVDYSYEYIVTNNVALQVLNTYTNIVPCYLSQLRVRTVMAGTNATGTVEFSATVK